MDLSLSYTLHPHTFSETYCLVASNEDSKLVKSSLDNLSCLSVLTSFLGGGFETFFIEGTGCGTLSGTSAGLAMEKTLH